MESRTEMWPHEKPTRVGHILALINTFPLNSVFNVPDSSGLRLDFRFLFLMTKCATQWLNTFLARWTSKI